MNGSEKDNKEIKADINLNERFGHPEKMKRNMIFIEVTLGLFCALMSFLFHIVVEITVF